MATVRTRNYSWEALCRAADPEMDARQVVYEFSNGRKFLESRSSFAVVPTIPTTARITQEGDERLTIDGEYRETI